MRVARSHKRTILSAAPPALALAALVAATRPSHPVAIRPDHAAPAPGQPPSAGLLFGRPIPLNRATLDDLLALPGIGATRAQAILDLRAARNGRFDSLDDLLDVPGIGPASLRRLRSTLTLDP
jgi:competence protein ComEA